MAETADLVVGLSVGEGIFYMKVGTHAGETIDQIVARKQEEIEREGFTLWGYGGSNCHPLSIVQPFAHELQRDGKIRLLMEQTHASHFAADRQAKEYSEDGITWTAIPAGIEVKGSRYALVITDLAWVDTFLPLEQTQIPIGPNLGRRGDHYVTGLVDKACLQVTDNNAPVDGQDHRHITLAANIREPFAVFLRDYRE